MTKIGLTLFLCWSGVGITPVLSHGAKITYEHTAAITIRATYDSGEPMREAQVVVYAPHAPSEPWLKGKTDKQGKFIFTPDANNGGNWEIKVRQAGHGDIISIPVGKTVRLGQVSPPNDYTPLQKLLMSVSTVWGFVGTALFFAHKKGNS